MAAMNIRDYDDEVLSVKQLPQTARASCTLTSIHILTWNMSSNNAQNYEIDFFFFLNLQGSYNFFKMCNSIRFICSV